MYDELRRLASQLLAQETPGQTLQPTALVHEAYVRLTGKSGEEAPGKDLLVIDEALTRLGALDPLKAEVVKLRFFAGLTMPEIAQSLNLSLATVERYWTFARTWLYSELTENDQEQFGKDGKV